MAALNRCLGGRGPAGADSFTVALQAPAYNSAMQQTATPSAGVQIAHLLRSRPQLMAGSLGALTVSATTLDAFRRHFQAEDIDASASPGLHQVVTPRSARMVPQSILMKILWQLTKFVGSAKGASAAYCSRLWNSTRVPSYVLVCMWEQL